MSTSTKPWKIFLARPDVGQEELDAIRTVFDSGFLTEWQVTRSFERAVAEYVGAKYAIATTSCTTAMETVLKALGLSKGEPVLIPDFTHPATADAVILAGGTPVLADTDIDSRNLSVAALEAALPKGLRFVLGVSLFGNPLSEEIYSICRDEGVTLIEDAACSLGSMIGSRKVGSLAKATCFSFHPRKIITTGEGGIITTDQDELATESTMYKNFGYHKGEFFGIGTNYKMSDILAAIGLQQLRRLEEIIQYRLQMAEFYNELLCRLGSIRLPKVRPGTRHNFQSYTVYFERQSVRDEVMSVLWENGVEVQIGTYALHLQPAFRDCERIGTLTSSELLYKHLLTLPLHCKLTKIDQKHICKFIEKTCG